MYDKVLIIGTGQIGKAILRMVIDKKPRQIIIHNLTKKESDIIVTKYKEKYKNIKFYSSYGNIFMPYHLKDLNNKNLIDKADDIIEYFYSEMDEDILEKSSISTLVKKYKPTLIIDAINSATVLGKAYNPEQTKKSFYDNSNYCCKNIMAYDYTTKIINFVYSLKYAMEKYSVKKYIKVSTTGLGGMGINMPYTHGDNPKIQLSSALMGKISASGVLHQLLWNLSHTKGIDVSLIIPSTFVGYDSVLDEPIETDKGLLKTRDMPVPIQLEYGKQLKYNKLTENGYLKFPVVRAGENHVYSQLELNVLTAIGQMEAITKEEVANHVINCIDGKTNNDILSAMDKNMLLPTYLGREMIYEINEKIDSIGSKNYGIATGNLGVTLSKQLYELFLIKKCFDTVSELKKASNKQLTELVNHKIDKKIIQEIITLGIPIITNDGKIYIGDYSLVPALDDNNKVLTEQNLESWSKIGWVDLRENNLVEWKKKIIMVYENASTESKIRDNCIDKNYRVINEDYDIAEYIAYYNNLMNKGRKK